MSQRVYAMFERLFGTKPMEPPRINDLLQQISKRAERLDSSQQAKTFVAVGGMDSTLLNTDHRIIFGRRGTGKTHLLSHIADTARKRGEFAVLIDLRTMGSNSYIYGDENLSIGERATRLLKDFVQTLHENMFDQLTLPGSKFPNLRVVTILDDIGACVKEVLVTESVEFKDSFRDGNESKISSETRAKFGSTGASVEAGLRGDLVRSESSGREATSKGKIRLSVNIGRVNHALLEFANRLNTRIWVLLDEWSAIPEALQPYLADFIKRTLFPVRHYSVQIAAIEQRSRFRDGVGAETLGIELGSDAAADINLDDYLVFENDPQRSLAFFRDMLFRHLQAVDPTGHFELRNSSEFVRLAFTQEPAFRQLARACEGVPRDAINIIQLAAARAQGDKISIPHIEEAAKDWFDRDKASFVNGNTAASALLRWIIEEVIGARKARAFLVRSDVKNDILERLFDERVLHIAKRSYSTKEEPGVRYRVWKIDYGCYIDLKNTSRAPTGFLFDGIEYENAGEIRVPEDDFRAIRRAVLDLGKFSTAHLDASSPVAH
jgi:hypothetical protein